MYELHDHLGNVRVLTQDQVWYDGMYNNINQAGYYNYYAFGSLMPGTDRLNDVGYKFGFNGQEKDDYISGAGNTNTAKFWQYDTRIGRRQNTDPVINPSISPYAVMEGSPIWKNDPFGNTVKVTSEANEIIQEGLTATLGNNNPIGYDKEKGELTIQDFDKSKFSDKQVDLINRYGTLIKSTKDIVNVSVVNYFEKTEKLSGKSLAEIGAVGVTMTSYLKDSKTLGIVGSQQDIVLSRNPQRKENGNYENERVYYRGLSSIHELAGHAYLKVVNPTLKSNEHNSQVEKFEKDVRQFYIFDGKPIRGFATTHAKTVD